MFLYNPWNKGSSCPIQNYSVIELSCSVAFNIGVVLLPGKSHGWRSLVGCSLWGCEESDTTELLPFHFSLSCIGKGNGNPLQCSCLENPRDGRAWWAAVYGVAQSRTRLKRLSSSSSRAETCIDVASSWWCVVGVSHTGCTTTCLILPSDWNQAKGCFYLLFFILPRWMELLVAPNFLSA